MRRLFRQPAQSRHTSNPGWDRLAESLGKVHTAGQKPPSPEKPHGLSNYKNARPIGLVRLMQRTRCATGRHPLGFEFSRRQLFQTG